MHSQSRALSLLPNIEYYQRLREFTKEMISQIVDDVYTPMNQELFYKLRNLIACRLTLFNSRREVTRLTMLESKDDFKTSGWTEDFPRKLT